MITTFIARAKFLAGYGLPILIVMAMTKCSPPTGSEAHIREVTSLVDNDYLVHADQAPENWVSYGRNYAEDRFSSLKEINKENVKRLGLAWSLNLETTRGIEATPLVVDGIMFLSGPWSIVFAINTRTGKLIWKYDPAVPGSYGEKVCCDVVNRGLALYKGRVFVGTLDGRLISLDAANGKPVWEILTVDTTKYYTITGAPRVVDGKVIIGNGGAEYGVRGYITAYDAMSGEQNWRFYTVPGDPSQPFESKAMEAAAKTWAGEWWKYGGGGTAWDAMAYDPSLHLLYIGTGNGSPWNWFHRSNGSGDNLYLSSILALNPDNGELIWYYQTTPGDDWDYTATQHLILADLEIGGTPRKVIMQAPKNGFFYLVDRTNGELLSAEPYTYMNWALSVDLKTGRPVEADFSRYKNENVVISPGILGGHNWQPMAYNPITKLVYIPTHKSTSTYGHDPNWKFTANAFNSAAEINSGNPTRVDKSSPETMHQGRLIAWDPVKQEEVWGVNHRPTYWNGGVLTTAGELVFQGTADGRLVAYDARDGEKIWEYNVGSGVIAPPVTYSVDGKQYVSLAVGWGGAIGQRSKFTKENYPGTVFTFALDSNKVHPGFYESQPKQLIRMDFSASKDEIDNGSTLFAKHCNTCHKPLGKGGSIFPDLAYSSEGVFANFENIVMKGVLLKNGMPDFSGRLSPKEVTDIKNYILHTSTTLREQENK